MCDGRRTRAHSARVHARLTLWSLIKFHLKTEQRWLQLGFYSKRVGVALLGCEAPSGSFAELFIALFLEEWSTGGFERGGQGEGDKRLLASQGWVVCEWASVHVCEVGGGGYESRGQMRACHADGLHHRGLMRRDKSCQNTGAALLSFRSQIGEK